jgi:dipeptidyl aminopeptidase/acylaminoacyl peptidase
VSTHLFAVVPEDGRIMQLTRGLGTHSGFSFSADSRRMAYLGSDAEIPPDVFTSDVDVFVPLRVTRTNPEFEGLNLGRMEVLNWKSRDGLEIEGLLIKPVGFVSGRRYPLMTYVHGGPSGKFGYSVCPQIGPPSPYQAECYPLHVWAGLGYAIFLPNPRGSYGYGEKFRTANIKDWGYGDYRDIMTGIDDLIKRGIADPDRLGIMGRSYGGYMTGWIITQTNRFKAASLGAGMFNLTSFYGQTDIPGFMDYFFGGPPWEEGKDFRKSSPHEFSANIKTPTLILHGEKDFRVPVPQAQELYKVLTKRGVPVEFAVYPRQGHLAAEPKFHLDELKRNLNWFERWIGEPAAEKVK